MKVIYTASCASGYTMFGGIKFPEGEAVDVTDEDILTKLRGNLCFQVEPKKVEPKKRRAKKTVDMKGDDKPGFLTRLANGFID